MDVVHVIRVVLRIFDAAFRVCALPDVEFGLETERESALDELQGFFNRDFWCGGDEQVDVIGHDDEGVELITILRTIFVE